MPPLPDRPTANSQGSGQRTRPAGSTSSGSSGSATSRSGGDTRVTGGSTTSSGGAEARRPASTRGGGSSSGASSVVSGQRNRDGRPVVGIARDRSTIDRTVLPVVIGPWNSWYPWYSGLGWNFGYVTYGPYGYGSSRWLWGPYGWYDPWAYDPYYSPYYYGGGGGGVYEERYREREPKRDVGAIRLRANPDSARVYIDGALVGTVDEFNGLRNHLELDGGTHKIELRADGYETYTGELTVEVGKTLTERISLKKVKK